MSSAQISLDPKHDRPDTAGKALQVNVDGRRYGTFAEIGAGQEVVRWFFKVGGAAGTIAKSMSAYDMTVSDAIYGKGDRYVSRGRLEAMLDHEYKLNVERLSDTRGDMTAFFAFADTVSARNFHGTNECHGWMGVRFQVFPRDQESQILLHVRMLDNVAVLQQEALGIVGVNLLHGAFFFNHEPDSLVESLMDGLTSARIEIDMIEFSGIGFRGVDNRLMSLKLVQKGLSKAAMFEGTGKVLQPSEVFHKRPVLVERGSFRPVTKVNLDIMRCAKERFIERLDVADRDRVVTVAEITMNKLTVEGEKIDVRDFLARADVLGASGFTVLVSGYFEFFRLAEYVREFTLKPMGVAVGAVTLPELFDPKYYEELDGGLLEAMGRLFRKDVTVLVYPYLDPRDGNIRTANHLELDPLVRPLYDYMLQSDRVVSLENHDPTCLTIRSPDVVKQIAAGDPAWELAVPPAVAEMIKSRRLFGCPKSGC